MKFEGSLVNELASAQNVNVSVVTTMLEDAITDAYSKSPNAVEGATAKIDAGKSTLFIYAPTGQDVTPEDFGRMLAGTVRQAVLMWSKDVQRRQKLGAWAGKEGTLVTGKVKMHASRNKRGETVVDLGGNVEAFMPSGESIPGEVLKHDDDITAYVVAVNPDDRGRVRVTISRRQPSLVAELIRAQSPEVADGRVIITNVVRDPGARAKVAVKAAEGYTGDIQEAIFGAGAYRIRAVAAKLNREKIDIVVDNGVPADFVANSLTPARVVSVQQKEDSTHPHFLAVVPADQLSVAVGEKHRNIKLASKLTGFKIDVLIED